MAEVGAVLVTSIEGVAPTDDGNHALLKLSLDNQEIVLAIPKDQLPQLLNLVSDAIAKTSQRGQPGKLAFPVSWWEFGKTADGSLAVSFRLQNGTELSFVLGANQISNMRETLQVMEGTASIPPTPDKEKN
jgi:hypothetical protein